MAAASTTNPTLLDLASRMESGSVSKKIVEALDETNDIVADMTFLECNDGSGHKTTIRSGLPEPTWRLLNYGVQPKKSSTVQVRDGTGMLENYSNTDKSLVDLSGNPSEFRWSEDKAHLEGMGQAFADTLIYGNTAINPERFNGLAARFSSLSATNAENIVNGAGAGATNTSIWLVTWSPDTAHGLYPKGSKAGLNARDLGEQTLKDATGGEYQGYKTHFKWDCGLTVRDWRYVVRIANVDVATLTKSASSGADLVDLMSQAIELLPNATKGRPVFYCNRVIRSWLRRQISQKSNVHLTLDNVGGKKVMTFDDIPVRRVDAILNTEAVVA